MHTIAEVWLPVYAKVKPDWRLVVFDRVLFLENIPVFIFAFVTALAGWKLPILGMILPAVGLTHPLIDHLFLSWKYQQLRPGTLTGLFLPELHICLLDENIAQVTYDRAFSYDGIVEHTHRSSIWSRTTNGWELRFHQGTLFSLPAENQE